MHVLLIGSGGREHALAWKLSQSPKVTKLFVAPGNAGTAELAENIDLDARDHGSVLGFCAEYHIDLVVIGPEAPLVEGLADHLRREGIAVFGPNKAAAQLEGSKSFTKALCDEYDIPTAAYARFTDAQAALDHLAETGAPIVIKADGLAAGKGVTVAVTEPEAENAINDCFSGSFGEAGAEVVIEECLEGEEVSVFAICDGTDFITLASAQDHKRAFDHDEGPNTGGMGAYSPASVLTDDLLAEVETDILRPTIDGMAARGTPFTGVLYAGLMLTGDGPKLIEYNVRFGDPECQVLMMRLESDLFELLDAAARGKLSKVSPTWRKDAAVTVVMAAKGYPGAYTKDTRIRLGTDDDPDVMIFHAGTRSEGHRLLSSGGRVLNVTAMGTDVAEARQKAYARINQIDWPDGFYRTDIGWRELARESAPKER